jgi:hypothetical protein
MSQTILDRAGKKILWIVVIVLFASAGVSRPLTTELFMRGYSVIPTPQRVQSESGDIQFDDGWGYSAQAREGQPALRSLVRDLKDFHSIDLKQATPAGTKLIFIRL